MTKKALLERIEVLDARFNRLQSAIEKIHDTIGFEVVGGWFDSKIKLGTKLVNLEDFQALLSHLKLEVKTIPGTPERKEIRVIPPVNVVSGGILSWTSCNLSTPPQPQCCEKPKKKPLKKKR